MRSDSVEAERPDDERRPGKHETGFWCAACRERHANSARDWRFKHRMVCRASQVATDQRRAQLSEQLHRANANPKQFNYR